MSNDLESTIPQVTNLVDPSTKALPADTLLNGILDLNPKKQIERLMAFLILDQSGIYLSFYFYFMQISIVSHASANLSFTLTALHSFFGSKCTSSLIRSLNTKLPQVSDLTSLIVRTG